MTPADAVAHLSPDAGRGPTASCIRKALAEFAHERLITPGAAGAGVTSSAATTA